MGHKDVVKNGKKTWNKIENDTLNIDSKLAEKNRGNCVRILIFFLNFEKNKNEQLCFLIKNLKKIVLNFLFFSWHFNFLLFEEKKIKNLKIYLFLIQL